jgi:drug/metabolite transporter (DMT)-like permease
LLSGATIPTLLANTAPLWVGLGAWLIFREELTKLFWTGLLIALSGSSVVLSLATRTGVEMGSGSLLGLLAGIFYAGYILCTQRGRESLDSITYFWIAAVSSVGFLLLYIFITGIPLTGYSSQTYISFIAMGVFSQAIAYLAINYALGYLPATIVSPTLLGQPVLTAILAGPLLGERITLWQMLAGLVVLIGILVVHRSRIVED